ncbi:excinuclease ABC subunit UvrA [Candidatus Falkowbacteria bacterium]|jgi:excinuclease ABC subunit A|nr:excinuclease ABC subunit UvrA [Candidatus Falkowbacteria bacterium]MBT4433313.1 excinuclease ABC subunit UvrA [Candidatus Falkowbacteria bacterium]
MNSNKIIVKGARVHNLKNLSVEIPRDKLVVITGLSGSGKSSLAFDTIYAEGQRRYAESFSAYARQFLGMMDKPDVDQIEGLSPTISIDQRTLTNNPRSTVGTMAEIYDYLRLLFARSGSPYCIHCGEKVKKKKILLPGVDTSRKTKKKYLEIFACPRCKERFPKLEPRLFSFNSPYGACATCKGLGTKLDVDIDLVIPNKKLSLAEGAIQPWTKFFSNQPIYWKKLEVIAKKYKFSTKVPVEKLKNKDLQIVLYGDPLSDKSEDKNSDFFEGVVEILQQKHAKTDSNFLRTEIEKYMKESSCPQCKGNRLRKEALNVVIDKKNISDITNMTITEARKWIKNLKFSKDERKITDQITKESIKRLDSLIYIGLDYLTLDRSATTLSGGEAQRVRIANQINSLLTNVIYILDEPSIGLHPRDIDKLISTLKVLRDAQNTVIVVEHEEKIMEAADHIIDVGPGAGIYGGEIVAEGTYNQILKNKKSLTGKYLRKEIKQKKNFLHKGSGKNIEIIKAKEHNLKNISVKFPLGKFICVTGVSGSGKSTLIIDILGKALAKKFYRAKAYPGQHKEIKGIENINKVIRIDQSPIGKTPRSNPATYTGVFTHIRNLFTSLQESINKGYDAGFFSFNVDGGRCQLCSGEGYAKVEMQFLTDVYVECEECHGKRYSDKALEVYYKGKNIADILSMSVEEAMNFFKNVPTIYDKLKVLHNVGLGYLPLGQSATTLSGGEAQRIKLATELSKRSTGKTLYILDEPTTGLHFDDIKKLLTVLEKLVDKGNTVLVIEHNLDVVAQADWIIDLGPEGGEKGGKIVFEGPPQEIIECKKSYTGKYLK